MTPKNLGYVCFIGACLLGAGMFVVRAALSDDEASVSITGRHSLQQTRPAAGGAATHVASAQPIPQPPPPPAPAADPLVAMKQALVASPRVGLSGFASFVEKRPWASAFVDRSSGPFLTRAEIRRIPIASHPTTRPALAICGLADVPPLAAAILPAVPDSHALATGAGYAIESPAQPLPLIRLPMVLRPRPETLPPQGEPVLNERGKTILPVLPPLRRVAAPFARPADSIDHHNDVQAAPHPDDNTPAAARNLVPPM